MENVLSPWRVRIPRSPLPLGICRQHVGSVSNVAAVSLPLGPCRPLLKHKAWNTSYDHNQIRAVTRLSTWKSNGLVPVYQAGPHRAETSRSLPAATRPTGAAGCGSRGRPRRRRRCRRRRRPGLRGPSRCCDAVVSAQPK